MADRKVIEIKSSVCVCAIAADGAASHGCCGRTKPHAERRLRLGRTHSVNQCADINVKCVCSRVRAHLIRRQRASLVAAVGARARNTRTTPTTTTRICSESWLHTKLC